VPDLAPEESRPLGEDPRLRASVEAYWRRNLLLMAVLLGVWAFVGLGCGVLLADRLNAWSLGGFPLGFWCAQQGSIVVFVLLTGIYALAMRRLDRIHHAELVALARSEAPYEA